MGTIPKNLIVLCLPLFIFYTAVARPDTCSKDYEVLVSSGSFELNFGSAGSKASGPVVINIGSSGGAAALPVPAAGQAPAALKVHFPDLDIGNTKPEEFRVAHGGQATVMIPPHGKHVVRVARFEESEKAKTRLETDRILVARLKAAGLGARFVLPIHEKILELNGSKYFVQSFEKYDGSLADLYKTDAYKKLSYLEKTKLASDLAESIRQLHEAGIFHLDLKSDNILYRLNADGKIELAIADLGLMADPKEMKADGIIRGTPFYISPTAISQSLHDPRNDIYPLGVVFQELMTGQLVREVARSEQGRPIEQALPGNASPSQIVKWLSAGTSSSPFRFHTGNPLAAVPNQTRIAFPYGPPSLTDAGKPDTIARENLAVVAWFPFRSAAEMSAATAEAAKNPAHFKEWLLEKLFTEKAAEKSSYDWKENGGHILQSLLSNDVFAGWVTSNLDKIPAPARAAMLADLKLIHEAVRLAETPGGTGEGVAGNFRATHSETSASHLAHTRLYLTNKEITFNLWFGRFVNGHALEKLIHRLEAKK